MVNIKSDARTVRGGWHILLGVIPALLLGACAADPADGASGDPEHLTAKVSANGVITEISNLTHVAGLSDEKAGCTHIRFCSTPGNTGVITCDTNDKSCSGDARFNECLSDAKFVCGRQTPMLFDPAIPCPVSGICGSGGGTVIGVF